MSPDCRGALRSPSPAGRGREAGERDRVALRRLARAVAVAARMRGWYTARVCGLIRFSRRSLGGAAAAGARHGSIHCGIHALLGLRSGPVTIP